MQEITRQSGENSMLHLGVSTVSDRNAPLIVTLIAKSGTLPTPVPQSPARPRRAEPAVKPEPAQAEQHQDLPSIPEVAAVEPPPADPRPSPAPRLAPLQPAKKPEAAPKPTAPKIKQETLQFEPVARGRFEKIEPTIVEGEDLDVPTFLRINVKKS